MPKGYLPTTNAKLRAWGLNLSNRVGAAPLSVGVTTAQSDELSAAFAGFDDALRIAEEPATRTRGTVAEMHTKKKVFIAKAREIVALIQAHPGLTDQQRRDLELTVRKPPSPSKRPGQAAMDVVLVNGRMAKCRVYDPADPTRRSRPEGVAGITICSFVGEEASRNIDDWKFESSTGRQVFDVEFPASLEPGTKVWLTAFYFNGRKESGMAAEPVSLYLGGGVSQAS